MITIDILIQFLFLSIMLAFGIFDPKYFLTQKSSGLMNYFLLSLMLKSLEQPEEITKYFFFYLYRR